MRTIYKYGINLGVTELDLPANAEVIHAGLDPREQMSIWCLVTPEAPTEKKKFVIKGTGHEIESNLYYIKTFNVDPFVWHLFELL